MESGKETEILLNDKFTSNFENEYFNKKIKYDESELTYKNINSDELSHTISVFDEVYKNEKFTFDDESRLGCNITVKNKYETTTSSEGFYLYMFKEYSTGLKPSTVYLSRLMTVRFWDS